jgi:hypothetical protein
MVKNEHLGQFKTGLCVFQTRPLWVETGQYRDFGRSRGRYRRRGRQLRRPYSFQFGKGGSMFGAHGPRSGSGSTFALRLAAFSTRAAATWESAVSFANLRRVAIRRPAYRLLATYTPPFGYRSRLQDVAARDLFRAESCKIVGGLFFNGGPTLALAWQFQLLFKTESPGNLPFVLQSLPSPRSPSDDASEALGIAQAVFFAKPYKTGQWTPQSAVPIRPLPPQSLHWTG